MAAPHAAGVAARRAADAQASALLDSLLTDAQRVERRLNGGEFWVDLPNGDEVRLGRLFDLRLRPHRRADREIAVCLVPEEYDTERLPVDDVWCNVLLVLRSTPAVALQVGQRLRGRRMPSSWPALDDRSTYSVDELHAFAVRCSAQRRMLDAARWDLQLAAALADQGHGRNAARVACAGLCVLSFAEAQIVHPADRRAWAARHEVLRTAARSVVTRTPLEAHTSLRISEMVHRRLERIGATGHCSAA